PWWAEPVYDIAIIHAYKAAHDDIASRAAARTYLDLFARATPPSDPRIAELRATIDDLDKVDAGLKAPPTVGETRMGRWPFGLTAFTMDVAAAPELRFPYGALSSYATQLAPGAGGGVPVGGMFTADLKLRVVPRVQIGAFVGGRKMGSFDGPGVHLDGVL